MKTKVPIISDISPKTIITGYAEVTSGDVATIDNDKFTFLNDKGNLIVIWEKLGCNTTINFKVKKNTKPKKSIKNKK